MTDTGDDQPAAAPAAWPPGLALLAGLAPLVAASRSAAGGLALGLACLAVLGTGNLATALLGGLVPPKLRIPVYLLTVGALVAAVDLLLEALWFGLYTEVGPFVPLIACTALVPGLAAAGTGEKAGAALVRALAQGAGITAFLAAAGALRGVLAPAMPLAALAPAALLLLAAVAALARVTRRPAP
jgi:Na+-translocating ferredoxin:NAD+ oxidoreductase RnfE subunit